jgi:hypothetical protein
MGQRVPRIRTEVSESELVKALISAWQKLFGSMPTKEQIAMLLAQNALETGHRKSMWNYNIGNVTTDGKGKYNYFDDLTTNEQISPGKWKKMNLKYRAFNTLDEGALDYIKFLKNNYATAWQHIINPNPEEYSKALKKAGYYTADEIPYTKNMVSLFSHFSKSPEYDKAKSGITEESNVMGNKDSISNKSNFIMKINDLLDKLMVSLSSLEKYNIVKKQKLNINTLSYIGRAYKNKKIARKNFIKIMDKIWYPNKNV